VVVAQMLWADALVKKYRGAGSLPLLGRNHNSGHDRLPR